MKKLSFFILMMACIVLTMTLPLGAQTTGSQNITILVEDINEISVSGSPGTLSVHTASAGFQPDDATNSSSTYSLTTNCSNKKITGVLNSTLPPGVTLKVNLAAPAGATSLGDVTLSSTSADLVSGISSTKSAGLSITYKLSATVSGGTVNLSTKTVIFTISN